MSADEVRRRDEVEAERLAVLPVLNRLHEIGQRLGGGDQLAVLAGYPLAGVLLGKDHGPMSIGALSS